MAAKGLTTYEPVHIALPDVRVTERDIDKRVREIVESIPEYGQGEACELRMHDKAHAIVTLKENGAVLPGLDNAELTITVGDGFLPQPFAEGIVGMSVGERREFSFSVPALGSTGDDGCLSTMDAVVELLEVRRKTEAVLSDEWVAAHIPRADTVDQLRDDVRKRLEEERTRKRDELKEARCLAALAERLEEPPDAEAIADATACVQADFERKLAAQGKTKEQQLQAMGISEEQLRELFAAEGARIAAEGRALELAAAHFGIEADVGLGGFEGDAGAESGSSDPGGEPVDADKLRTVALYEKTLGEIVRCAIVESEVQPPRFDPFS